MRWGKSEEAVEAEQERLRTWRPWFAWYPVDVTDRYPDAMYRDDVSPARWVWMETVERRMVMGRSWPFWCHRMPGEERAY